MRCNEEFFYVGKIPFIGIGVQRRVALKWFYGPPLQRHIVLQWFYSLPAVGTTLSEVHELYQVPF